jgi:hypothetical protein
MKKIQDHKPFDVINLNVFNQNLNDIHFQIHFHSPLLMDSLLIYIYNYLDVSVYIFS